MQKLSKRQVLFLNIRFSLSLLACSQLIYQGSVQNVCFGNITNYYWSAPYKSLRFQIITSYFSTDSKTKFQLILFYYCRQTKITLTFCSLLVSCVTNSIWNSNSLFLKRNWHVNPNSGDGFFCDFWCSGRETSQAPTIWVKSNFQCKISDIWVNQNSFYPLNWCTHGAICKKVILAVQY